MVVVGGMHPWIVDGPYQITFMTDGDGAPAMIKTPVGIPPSKEDIAEIKRPKSYWWKAPKDHPARLYWENFHRERVAEIRAQVKAVPPLERPALLAYLLTQVTQPCRDMYYYGHVGNPPGSLGNLGRLDRFGHFSDASNQAEVRHKPGRPLLYEWTWLTSMESGDMFDLTQSDVGADATLEQARSRILQYAHRHDISVRTQISPDRNTLIISVQ